VAGPGVGSTNSVGIWLAEPDGALSPIVRAGDTITSGGVSRKLGLVTFGNAGIPTVGGPEDGRAVPFNDRGEIFFSAYLSSGQGLFLAHSGLTLAAMRAGGDIVLSFPTDAGKHYRVDYKNNLSAPAWSVAVPSVIGTGAEVAVTNTPSSRDAGFYRVARTD